LSADKVLALAGTFESVVCFANPRRNRPPSDLSLDGLVPKDHLLRKTDALVDLSFIHDPTNVHDSIVIRSSISAGSIASASALVSTSGPWVQLVRLRCFEIPTFPNVLPWRAAMF
jgi:hypothetical protein